MFSFGKSAVWKRFYLLQCLQMNHSATVRIIRILFLTVKYV